MDSVVYDRLDPCKEKRMCWIFLQKKWHFFTHQKKNSPPRFWSIGVDQGPLPTFQVFDSQLYTALKRHDGDTTMHQVDISLVVLSKNMSV